MSFDANAKDNKELSFEEEFPSIDCSCILQIKWKDASVLHEIPCLHLTDVQEKLKDKQLLKEKVLSMPEVDTEGGKCVVCSKSYLIEELGL